MQKGHSFHEDDGFTGSHHTEKEFRPSVPGFKRGGNKPQKMIHPGNDGEMTEPPMGGADSMPPENLKHGGLSHIKSHHKNYAHGGRVEHDNHPKHDHVKYDEHGYAHHKGHGHKAMKEHKED